ncbi:MAG: hypothetical protein ABIG84_02275 [archaeon]
MQIIIPVWFYGYDSVIYLINSFIGFLLSFYFYRIFSLSSEKKHLYLHLGFLFLSVGLLILSIISEFSYLAYENCLDSSASCSLGLLDSIYSIEDFSYFAYFGLSIFAYILFLAAYGGEYVDYSRILIIALLVYLVYIVLHITYIPVKEGHILWYTYREYFNMAAIALLAFISFRNIANYFEMKSLNSLLVALSFSFLALYHVIRLFSFISGLYVLGHIFMLLAFGALLLMVVRVKRR